MNENVNEINIVFLIICLRNVNFIYINKLFTNNKYFHENGKKISVNDRFLRDNDRI